MRKMAHGLGLLAVLALAACAAPPLTLYTLSDEALVLPAPPLGAQPRIVEVARVSIPDDLDNDDIIVRDNHILRRSTKGRWASRLSLEITGLITRQLAEDNPDAVVTNERQPAAPADRVRITISRLDITADGRAELTADWLIIPQDVGKPVLRDRAHFSMASTVATDHDVVSLETALVKDLADAIRLP